MSLHVLRLADVLDEAHAVALPLLVLALDAHDIGDAAGFVGVAVVLTLLDDVLIDLILLVLRQERQDIWLQYQYLH